MQPSKDMKTIKFNAEVIPSILSGQKTQARRLILRDDYSFLPGLVRITGLIAGRDAGQVVYTDAVNGLKKKQTQFRPRFAKGDVASVADESGRKQKVTIKILDVFAERIGDISNENMVCEGVCRERFNQFISQTYGVDVIYSNAWLWAYKFEVVKK